MCSRLTAVVLAVVAVLVAPVETLRASEADPLERSEIWRHCEHYFLTVEHYKAAGDHYAIRDVSLEFVRTVRRFEPAGEREAFLYAECLNLASGNATLAHETIQREQAEDREFFDLARIDAENNANAARFDYMKQLDGKRDLASDAEIAEDAFRNLLEVERSRAASVVVRFSSSLSSSGAGGEIRWYNNSTASPFAGWRTFAASAKASAGGGSGAASAQGYGGSGTTIAPVTPPTGAQPSGGGAVAITPPEPAGSTTSGAAAPQEATLERARHLDQSCASYRVTDPDGGLASVTNRCAEPIVFHWCWVPHGRADCSPNLLSDVIASRQSEPIPGPDDDEQAVAAYVVCDMTDRQRLCLK